MRESVQKAGSEKGTKFNILFIAGSTIRRRNPCAKLNCLEREWKSSEASRQIESAFLYPAFSSQRTEPSQLTEGTGKRLSDSLTFTWHNLC